MWKLFTHIFSLVALVIALLRVGKGGTASDKVVSFHSVFTSTPHVSGFEVSNTYTYIRVACVVYNVSYRSISILIFSLIEFVLIRELSIYVLLINIGLFSACFLDTETL